MDYNQKLQDKIEDIEKKVEIRKANDDDEISFSCEQIAKYNAEIESYKL